MQSMARSCFRSYPIIPRIQARRLSSQPPLVRLERLPAAHSGHIGVLYLDRPAQRNALSIRLMNDLRHLVQSIRDEAVPDGMRALIIASSSPGAFCAGADLKERKVLNLYE